MRCKRPLTRSERPLNWYEAIGESGWGVVGCTYAHMDVWKEDLPHCVVQDCVSFRVAAQKGKLGREETRKGGDSEGGDSEGGEARKWGDSEGGRPTIGTSLTLTLTGDQLIWGPDPSCYI